MNHPVVRWSAWVVFSVLWTIGLVVEGNTIDRIPLVEDLGNWRVIVAKIIHFGIYAFWTVFTGWLKTPLRVRIFLLMFLMAHAVGTEWRQTYVPGRFGSLRDSAIDQGGILLGVLLSFRWWTAADRSVETTRVDSDAIKAGQPPIR